MRRYANILFLCGALAALGGCVEPIADVWLLTSLHSTPSVAPDECTYYFNVDGYLDIDAGLAGTLDYSFDCGGSGWHGNATIERVAELGDGSYQLELRYTTGSGSLSALACEISGRTMTCRSNEDGQSDSFEFERGPWFDNTPP